MKPHPHYACDPGVETLLTAPKVILFDWQATLVDTLDAMYHAVDELLPKLDELRLVERLVTGVCSKTIADARLVEYVREHRRSPPKIKAERTWLWIISGTLSNFAKDVSTSARPNAIWPCATLTKPWTAPQRNKIQPEDRSGGLRSNRFEVVFYSLWRFDRFAKSDLFEAGVRLE